MTEVQKEEGQKTIVSFVVGLLIGGLLVWAFTGGEKAEAPATTETPDTEVATETESVTTEDREENTPVVTPTPAPTLPVGDGSVVIENQPASARIAMKSATYPISEGWIGVRDYVDGRLGSILGVVRFSEEQGLVPNDIILQRPTRQGNTYAVVIFSEDGDRRFNSAGDVQIDKIFATFTAQ